MDALTVVIDLGIGVATVASTYTAMRIQLGALAARCDEQDEALEEGKKKDEWLKDQLHAAALSHKDLARDVSLIQAMTQEKKEVLEDFRREFREATRDQNRRIDGVRSLPGRRDPRVEPDSDPPAPPRPRKSQTNE